MSDTKYGCTSLPENYKVNAGVAKWQRHNITWHLLNADDIAYNELKPICSEVFSQWQDAFDYIKPRGRVFTFMSVADARKADIVIVFCRRNHRHMGCKDQRGINHVIQCVWDFDGKDGVLAHAFSLFSSYNAGQVHIDKGEDFTKVNFKEILLHELGHVFNLSHSESKNALMYAAYRGDFDYIARDDADGLQVVWGEAKNLLYSKFKDTHKSLVDADFITKANTVFSVASAQTRVINAPNKQRIVAAFHYMGKTVMIGVLVLILIFLYIAFISNK